jgi:hypothetical protein
MPKESRAQKVLQRIRNNDALDARTGGRLKNVSGCAHSVETKRRKTMKITLAGPRKVP